VSFAREEKKDGRALFFFIEIEEDSWFPVSVLLLSFYLILEVESLLLDILCAAMCEVGGIGDGRRIPGRREGELTRRQEQKSKRGCYLFSLSLAALQALGKITSASAAAHLEREERQLRSQREERENKN
jgi:hypothetical protein